MRKRLKQTTVLVSISLVLGGCASTKETVLPQDGPSMKTIYDAHFESMGARDPKMLRGELGHRPLGTGSALQANSREAPLDGYMRGAYHSLETTFPRLPNPTLVMYVFPHLASAERVPVPGYVTTFPMYERVEYALPGEVSPLRSDSGPLRGSERDRD